MQFTYQGRDFYLNGEKFVVRSGAIHYFRTPKFYWEDRLLKLKECGFNTVETYVAWNLHEPKEGEFRFDGELDLGEFFDTAARLGLYVMLRPGPYICAEWEFGGFPAWLLKYENMRLRCNDETYFSKLAAWSKELFKVVTPRLITNGGNILMVQVENEYGAYGNDREYLERLRDLYKELGVDTVMFTTDGWEDGFVESSKIDGCPAFYNFGSDTERLMEKLANVAPDQPLMCAEFWCGWFDHWYENHHVRSPESICTAFEPFLKHGYNVNFYMFHGGTNFAFMNGANNHTAHYQPTVTSYDYNALLTETGDRTPQYYGVRNLMVKYGVPVPELTAKESKKIAYGNVKFTAQAKLFDNMDALGTRVKSPFPITMENLGQAYGYVYYEAYLPACLKDYYMQFDGLGDRAIVYIDDKKVGVVERGLEEKPIYFSTGETPVKIGFLVENTGRTNFGPNLIDKKGLAGVRLRWEYVNRNLTGFESLSLPMDNLEKLKFSPILDTPNGEPTFYRGEFEVDEVADTFIKPSGFTKGFILINGVNIGRYYNPAGPQKTLYVPACWLKKGKNEIVLFETDGVESLTAEFVDTPEL
jgi:beta-galactosidase